MNQFDTFERDFARSERRFRIFFGVIVGLGMIAYQLATTSPDDIAKSAGHLVGTFTHAVREVAKP